MKLRILLVYIILGIACLTLQAPQMMIAQGVIHPWHVVDNGGGKSTAGSITLQASIGQPAVAAMSSGGTNLEGGYIPGIRFLNGTTSVLDLPLEAGWNLLSVPFIMSDFRKVVLYPTGTTAAFAYQGSYLQKDTMKNGIGYWIKFASPGSDHFSGTTLTQDTIHANNNWNLIGSLSYPTLITDITPLDTTSFVSHFFGYKGTTGYFVEDTLMPGKAYWIKVHNAGRVVIKTGSVVMDPAIASKRLKDTKRGIDALAQGKSGTLTIRDSGGKERTLSITTNAAAEELEKWEMPPILEGVMDARFATNRMMESDEASKPKEVGITITSAEYPIVLSWKVGEEMKGVKLAIEEKEVIVSGTGEARIPSPESRIVLKFAPSSQHELPRQFALYQNYPNPFNPATTIRYDLPKESHVRIVIYDALGQEVNEIVARDQEAGYQSILWEGTNARGNGVASGMYFYSIAARPVRGQAAAGDNATTFTEVRKMLLVR